MGIGGGLLLWGKGGWLEIFDRLLEHLLQVDTAIFWEMVLYIGLHGAVEVGEADI